MTDRVSSLCLFVCSVQLVSSKVLDSYDLAVGTSLNTNLRTDLTLLSQLPPDSYNFYILPIKYWICLHLNPGQVFLESNLD